MGSRTEHNVLMVLGYSPEFGRAFSEAASLIGHVVNLREVEELSGPPDPRMPYLHQVADSEYELLAPKRRPQSVWHNPSRPIHGRRFVDAVSHLESAHGPFELIHGHFYSSVLNALQTGYPVAVSEHSSVFGRRETGDRKVPKSIRLARSVYQRISLALPVSQHAATLMRASGIATDMRVVHNPVPLFAVPCVERTPPTTQVKLLTACRLAPTKNLIEIADAVRLVADSGLDVFWTVVGDGSERGHLQRHLKELGLEGSVLFRGRVEPSEVAKEMAEAHIYVMASTVESFGLPVVESLMTGLPVVATPVGVAPELSDLPLLLIVDGYTAVDIAAGLRRVVDHYPKAAEQSDIAREVAGRFSPEAIADQLSQVYESITLN